MSILWHGAETARLTDRSWLFHSSGSSSGFLFLSVKCAVFTLLCYYFLKPAWLAFYFACQSISLAGWFALEQCTVSIFSFPRCLNSADEYFPCARTRAYKSVSRWSSQFIGGQFESYSSPQGDIVVVVCRVINAHSLIIKNVPKTRSASISF